MKVFFHKKFLKSHHKLSTKLQTAVAEKLRLFSENPQHQDLRNHKLFGKYEGYRSIDINSNYWAIYKVLTKNEVLFVKTGTYSQIYK